MVNLNNILNIFIVCCLLVVTNLEAAFWELKPGAKAGGVAYSYSSVVEDAAAVFYNPANLTLLKKPNLALDYSKLYSGLGEDDLSLKSFFYAIPETEIGSYGAGMFSFSGDYYTETSYFLSYAKSFRTFKSGFAFGLSFKYLRRNYLTNYSTDIGDDPFFAKYGSAVSNFTFDAALTYQNRNGFRHALIFKNTNSPDMAFQEHISDRLPLVVSYGVSRKFNFFLPFRISAELEMMDIEVGKALNRFWYAAGVESYLDDYNLVGRVGINKNEITAGLSYNELSYHKFNFGFNYSLSVPFSFTDEALPGNLTTHRLGFNVFFGRFLTPPSLLDSRWQREVPKDFILKNGQEGAKKELVLWVKDKGGNISMDSKNIIFDSKPPVILGQKLVIEADNSVFLDVETDGASYYRWNNGIVWSEWTEFTKLNPVGKLKKSGMNFLTYEIKDKAGNSNSRSLLYDESGIVKNGESFPVIKKLQLINLISEKESAYFPSDSLVVETVASGAKEAELVYTIDGKRELRTKFSRNVYIDLSHLKEEKEYNLEFWIENKDKAKSNIVNKKIYIDNFSPRCYYRINGRKDSHGFYGASLTPRLTTYQSFDTREWLFAVDTLAKRNWSSEKPSKYSFKDRFGNSHNYHLYLKVRDEAGNESDWYENNYNYDNSAPSIEDFVLEESKKDGVYKLNSNLIIPEISVSHADFIVIIFDDKSQKKYQVLDSKVIFPSPMTIPQTVKSGSFEVRAYNSSGKYDKISVRYIININKPVISELELFNLSNGSTTETNSPLVGLHISGINLKKIMISEDINFMDAKYEDYTSSLCKFRLSEGDGIKYVFIKGRDQKRISSEVKHVVIKLDTKAPDGKFKITSKNNVVDFSKIEILYEDVSEDVDGYYLTEDPLDRPAVNDHVWSQLPIKFYNFNTKNDGMKKVVLFLKDKAGNISEAIIKHVILKKFIANQNNSELILNSKNPEGTIVLSDIRTHRTDVSTSDTISLKITTDSKISAWLLSDKKLDDVAERKDGWLREEPTSYVFNNSTNNSKNLYLYLKDVNGRINQESIMGAIEIDKMVTYPGKVSPVAGTVIPLSGSKIIIPFNKELAADGFKGITVYCIGSKSGKHQVNIKIKGKKVFIEPGGRFSSNEKVALWVFGDYLDKRGKRGYIRKNLEYNSSPKTDTVKFVVKGFGGAIDGYSSDILIEGRFEGVDAESIWFYKFAPSDQFWNTPKKRYMGEILYQLDDFREGEVNFKAQYFTEKDESIVFESSLFQDNIAPAARMNVYGKKSSNTGYTNSKEIIIDIRADEDVESYLLEEIIDK